MSHHTPQRPEMTAHDLTFGIELECSLPNEKFERFGGPIRVGSHHTGIQIPGLPQGWTAMYDSSIRTNRPGYSCLEVVSPVLKGLEGLRDLEFVVRQLNEWNAKINLTMGLHIHVGTDDQNIHEPLRRNIKALKKVVALFARNEHGLFASTGTKSREHGDRGSFGRHNWCRSMRQQYATVANTTSIRTMIRQDRYHTLNLCNLAPGRFGTVECRVFQATTNATKILTYVQICLGLVEKGFAVKRTPTWSIQRNKFVGGVGAVKQLMIDLNWFQHRGIEQGHRFGRLTNNNDDPRLPSLEESRNEMARLAKKYDDDDRSSVYTVVDRSIRVSR